MVLTNWLLVGLTAAYVITTVLILRANNKSVKTMEKSILQSEKAHAETMRLQLYEKRSKAYSEFKVAVVENIYRKASEMDRHTAFYKLFALRELFGQIVYDLSKDISNKLIKTYNIRLRQNKNREQLERIEKSSDMKKSSSGEANGFETELMKLQKEFYVLEADERKLTDDIESLLDSLETEAYEFLKINDFGAELFDTKG